MDIRYWGRVAGFSILLASIGVSTGYSVVTCQSPADCNDNDVCTDDACQNTNPTGAPAGQGITPAGCVHTPANPLPAQCAGCCNTCLGGNNAGGRDPITCCANLDQFTCSNTGGSFTQGGACNDNNVCEEPPPYVQCGVAPVPAMNCRQITKPSRHRLSIDDWQGKYNKKDRLEWGWRRGEATSFADYGTPLTTTSYAVCMYDGNSNLVFGSSIPPGPPWKSFKTTYSYTNPALDDSGIRRIALKSRGAAAGRASIRVVGAGRVFSLGNQTPPGNYPDLAGFPIAAAPNPIRVQLINSDGNCWEGHYQNRIRRNQVINSRVSRLRARND